MSLRAKRTKIVICIRHIVRVRRRTGSGQNRYLESCN